MNICTVRKKNICSKPFQWHAGPEVFCTTDCLPEGVLDEPFAMVYTDLLEQYRVFNGQSNYFEMYETGIHC